jgi:EpsI family protein
MSDATTRFKIPDGQDPATVAALKRRTGILLALVVPATILTIVLVATQSRAMRVADIADKAIPTLLTKDGRTWTSTSLTFSDAELEILETRDYMYRSYTDGKGPPVDLCVIFSEDNRKGTHPPDVCLEGSGARILTRNDRPIVVAGTPIVLRELVTTTPGGQYMLVSYMYMCGDVFTPSYYQQQVQIVWNGLTRQNASGALIRYTTPMANSSDVERARSRTDELLAASFPFIRDDLKLAR